MTKNIVICFDGTWNRPEKEVQGEDRDYPTNVLKLARGVKQTGTKINQQVFYDWGVGSYESKVIGGITGKGINKNIMDGYRYILQNFEPGDHIYLFGFSRGAYTVRSLCGLINNCGILKRENAHMVQKAFDHYRKRGPSYTPSSENSSEFRENYSHNGSEDRMIHFVGVWDTVGALGIPVSFLGMFDEKDEFFDKVIGGNVKTARHALAIDELREDFEPTIWEDRPSMSLKQMWFVGVHSDIGGSYGTDKNGYVLADIPMKWMLDEAEKVGLELEAHLFNNLKGDALAQKHQSRIKFFKLKKNFFRAIDHGQGTVFIHSSVRDRYKQDPKYRPKNLVSYLGNMKNKWPDDENS